MSDKKESIKKEIKELVNLGRYIYYYEASILNHMSQELLDILNKATGFIKYKENFTSTQSAYQKWYSKSVPIIKQVLPDRLEEFKILYINGKKKATDLSLASFTISDYLLGIRVTRGLDKSLVFDPFTAVSTKIEQQISILDSCSEMIDSKLANIEGVLQSELFDSELEMAQDLLKKKHVRLAGALAGITLEVHLKKICTNHKITMKKANPTIADCNEELKKEEVIELTTWRLIQRLGDIRNLSVHAKEREPTVSEVEDLINGCKKLIAELF